MTRRRALVGAAVLVVYVATTWFARGLHPTTAPRVLFDGFAPQAPYRWVNPPSELRSGNQKPSRAKGGAKVGPQGSEALSVATSDGQAFVSLSEGSIPPHDSDTSVEAVLTPIDASTLGPLSGATTRLYRGCRDGDHGNARAERVPRLGAPAYNPASI